MPTEFKDRNGKTWTIALTGSSIRRIAQKVGSDLTDLGGSSAPLARLCESDAALANVLYAICKPQADKCQPPMDEDGFGDLLDAETLAAAEKAFFDEWGFFSRSRGRPTFADLIDAARALRLTEVETVAAGLAKQAATLAVRIAELRGEHSTAGCANSPALPEPAPTGEPSPS